MDFLYNLLVVTHMLGLAALIGAYLVGLAGGAGRPMTTVLVWGARLQLLTGLALVGIGEATSGGPEEFNHLKIGVKLAIAVAVAAVAEIASARTRRDGAAPTGLLHAAGGLAVVNVLVASLW